MRTSFKPRSAWLALALAAGLALPSPARAEDGENAAAALGLLTTVLPLVLHRPGAEAPPDGAPPPHRFQRQRVKVPPVVKKPMRPAARQVQAAPRPAALPVPPPAVTGEILVETSPTLPAADLLAIGRRNRLQLAQSTTVNLLGSRVHRFLIGDRRSLPAVILALRGERQVLSAQPNYLYRLLEDGPQAAPLPQYALALMHLDGPPAPADGAGSRIGLLDTGIAEDQPELGAAVVERFDPIGPVAGDDLGHATALAGIVAAHARLKGVAPAASLLSARAFARQPGQSPAGNSYVLLQGLDWLAGRQVRIVNMSFAGPKDPLFLREVKAAHDGGILAVAAAGNGGPGTEPAYPAADPAVIAVTAVDDRRRLYPAANRGAYVALAAPGVDILVAAPGKAYATLSGTSMAAAHVSGLLALLLQRSPTLTADAARQILTGTAADLGEPGPDPLFGAGLVDAGRALQAVSSPPAATTVKVSAP